MLARMRRHRESVERGPGVIAGHIFATTRFWAPTGGYPTPRRWALMCAFEDDDALERFERSAAVAAFHHRARESWRVTLEPTRIVDGAWRGWAPATEDVEQIARDEPVAVMTYGVLRPRWVPRFLRENQRIVAASMAQEGLVARIGLSDTALTASTFSIWRSQGDVARFAYGVASTHKPVIRPSMDTPWADDYFFARFRLRDSRGTWDGRDPVAVARAASAGAAAGANGAGPNGSGGPDHHALDPGQVSNPVH